MPEMAWALHIGWFADDLPTGDLEDQCPRQRQRGQKAYMRPITNLWNVQPYEMKFEVVDSAGEPAQERYVTEEYNGMMAPFADEQGVRKRARACFWYDVAEIDTVVAYNTSLLIYRARRRLLKVLYRNSDAWLDQCSNASTITDDSLRYNEYKFIPVVSCYDVLTHPTCVREEETMDLLEELEDMYRGYPY